MLRALVKCKQVFKENNQTPIAHQIHGLFLPLASLSMPDNRSLLRNPRRLLACTPRKYRILERESSSLDSSETSDSEKVSMHRKCAYGGGCR